MRSLLRVLVPVTVLIVLAAGCTSDPAGAGDGVATLDDADRNGIGDAASAETIESGNEVDAEAAALEFSACMRAEGLDFPDIAVDGTGRIDLRAGFDDVDRQSEEFTSAIDVCRPLLDGAGFGAGSRAAIGENVEIQDALVEFSACVRDAGYDVGDIELGAPGGQADGQGAGQQAGGTDDEDGDDGQQPRGQGAAQGGFGNRAARFATQLGLDYEDPEVAEVIDECATILDAAFTSAGIGRP